MQRIHPKNKHHCYNLVDCRQLLEQMGFTYDEQHSFEIDNQASAVSIEKIAGRNSGIVTLNKRTGQLTCTDNTK